MTNLRPRISGGRIRWIVGLSLAAAFCYQGRSFLSGLTASTRAPGLGASPAIATLTPQVTPSPESLLNPLENLARNKPLDLLREAQKRCRETVVDYTCFFRKQENLFGEMTDVQGADVRFRDEPFSVFMHWTENASKARRVSYIAGKWVSGGQPAAMCEPEGVIARAIVKNILRPIHGSDAKSASRRTIDQFGFENALDLILKYSLIAQQRGELKLSYLGEGEIDGRPTFVIERRLPYTGEGGEFPDRVLVCQLDKETLLPVQCTSYADDNKQMLLGQYTFTKVKLNIGLTDAHFDLNKIK